MFTEFDKNEVIILLSHLAAMLKAKISACEDAETIEYMKYTLAVCDKKVTMLKGQTIANFCEN